MKIHPSPPPSPPGILPGSYTTASVSLYVCLPLVSASSTSCGQQNVTSRLTHNSRTLVFCTLIYSSSCLRLLSPLFPFLPSLSEPSTLPSLLALVDKLIKSKSIFIKSKRRAEWMDTKHRSRMSRQRCARALLVYKDMKKRLHVKISFCTTLVLHFSKQNHKQLDGTPQIMMILVTIKRKKWMYFLGTFKRSHTHKLVEQLAQEVSHVSFALLGYKLFFSFFFLFFSSAILITNMYPRLISSQLPNALMKIWMWSPAHCSSGECGLNAENMVHCCVYMTNEVSSSSNKVITIN